jgi:mono/diheme cytochrome c family protein
MKRMARAVGGGRFGTLTLALVAVALGACSDPNLMERRGYSKAPLDRPGSLTRGEQPGEMARYGGLRRLRTDRIELPEQPAVAAPAPGERPTVELPEGVTAEMVAAGEQVYAGAGNCFACHAADGSGTPLAPGINDSQWLHIDGSFDELVAIIDVGVPVPAQYPAAMPPRGGAQLTDEQVRQVAAYVYTISR